MTDVEAPDWLVQLRTTIDEDERAARYAMQTGGTGTWSEPSSGVLCLGGVEGIDGLIPIGDLRLSRHIERHDPASVLAMVEAHRKILVDYEIVASIKAAAWAKMREGQLLSEWEARECYRAEQAETALLSVLEYIAQGYGIESESDALHGPYDMPDS